MTGRGQSQLYGLASLSSRNCSLGVGESRTSCLGVLRTSFTPCSPLSGVDSPWPFPALLSCPFSDQLFGWLLIGTVAILVFLTKCLKHYCSPLSYRQESYWTRYRANEDQLFQHTAEVHARVLAANNVRRFFGFVALNKEDEELVAKFPVESTQPRPQWNAITGVYLYRENMGLPLYSRLHKWAQGLGGKATAPDMEMALLPPSGQCLTPTTLVQSAWGK